MNFIDKLFGLLLFIFLFCSCLLIFFILGKLKNKKQNISWNNSENDKTLNNTHHDELTVHSFSEHKD